MARQLLLALFLAASATAVTAAPMPGASAETCATGLADKCKECGVHPVRACTHTECVACAEREGEKFNCTKAAEEKFCPTAPPPAKETCDEVMSKECGSEKANRTRCIRCLDANKAAVDKADCDFSQEEVFCHPVTPTPGRACLPVIERVCGVDRHNKTLCAKCVARNLKELESAHCSMAQEEEFCEGPPKPPAPSSECEKLLVEECEADKKNATLCHRCLFKHENQTRTAHCTYKQLDAFCGAAPKPPPHNVSCRVEIEELCGKERHNHTLCMECAEEHRALLEGHHCTGSDVSGFCKAAPKPPPGRACPRELEALCGEERANASKCAACVQDHAAVLKEKNCTKAVEGAFCKVAPAPKPSEACEKLLVAECEHERANETDCIECVKKDWNATGAPIWKACTVEQVDTFCHYKPTPKPPTPEPSSCRIELAKLCEAARTSKSKCSACITKNEKVLAGAKCTAVVEKEFCPK